MRRSLAIALVLLAGMFAAPSPASAAFPGRPGRIVFESTHWYNDNPEPALWTMKPDSTDWQRLAWQGFHPRWSPDGGRIAFTHRVGGIAYVFVVDADGTNRTRVLAGERAAWSPDGTRLAFHSYECGGICIQRIDSPRSTPRFLVDAYSFDWGVNNKIFFGCEDAQLCTIRPDGTGRRQLTTAGDNYDAAWSPDATKIAFTSTRLSPWGGGDELWLMNADGSRQRRLSNWLGDVEFDQDPNWSPDGSKILFASAMGYPEGSGSELYTVNLDGSNLRALTASEFGAEVSPDWQSR